MELTVIVQAIEHLAQAEHRLRLLDNGQWKATAGSRSHIDHDLSDALIGLLKDLLGPPPPLKENRG